MTRHEPENPTYDSAELDALLDSAMSGMLAKLEAGLDADAGLADIYARAGAQGAGSEPGFHADAGMHAGNVVSAGSSRLAEVCDQVGALGRRLAEVIRSASEAPFGGSSYLELARDDLMQLRTGLASRSLSKSEAERLTSHVQHDLDQADQILRSQHASTLDDLVRERTRHPAGAQSTLADQVRVVREMVIRLYAAAGQDSPLVPAR